MEHYLCISIGPVQDMIASARRCRDLWYGSYLLSEVCKAAALGLLESGTGLKNLIFPSPQNEADLQPGSDLNVANRIVAIVGDPSEAAAAAESACRARLAELAENAFRSLKDSLDRVAAEAQLRDLLEFYWVAVPLGNYKAARSQAERLLAARKNTRVFEPVSWGGSKEKSSLDGQREAVLSARDFSRVQQRRWGLRPGEHLCGIAALKRLGAMGEKKAALSTSHVASSPWVRKNSLISSPTIEEFRESLEGVVDERDLFGRDGRIDGHLLYEERLLSYVDEASQDRARQALKALYQSSEGRPSPYYTILLADGDRMGVAIDSLDRNDHQKLTRALSKFASIDVPNIVKANHGYLIYSGGDDILAMLPVDTALRCSGDLAAEFARAMAPYKVDNQGPTLSVGLAVRHHMDPLNDGLAAVRRAEKKAKETRNALAVSLDKRGGAEILVAGYWGALDMRLQRYADQSSRVSTGFAYELRDFATRHSDRQGPMVQKEAARIVKRKEGPGKSKLCHNEIKDLLTDIAEVGAVEVAHQLIVARFFSDFTPELTSRGN